MRSGFIILTKKQHDIACNGTILLTGRIMRTIMWHAKRYILIASLSRKEIVTTVHYFLQHARHYDHPVKWHHFSANDNGLHHTAQLTFGNDEKFGWEVVSPANCIQLWNTVTNFYCNCTLKLMQYWEKFLDHSQYFIELWRDISYNSRWYLFNSTYLFFNIGCAYNFRYNHATKPLLKSHQLCSHSNNSQHFMQPEGSLQCS